MNITAAELSELVRKAAFLKERIAEAGCAPESAEPAEASGQLFDTWVRHAGGNGGETAFRKRLSADGIEAGQAARLLGDSPKLLPGEAGYPEWVLHIQNVLMLLPHKGEAACCSFQGHTPLLTAALQPFADYAGKKLDERLAAIGVGEALLSAAAKESLLRSLYGVLRHLAGKTYRVRLHGYIAKANPLQAIMGRKHTASELESYESAFCSELLAGGWKSALLDFPVLARTMGTAVAHWMDSCAQFALHLQTDIRELERLFNSGRPLGPAVSVECGLSDLHNGGKSVLIPSFACGAKIVYKPRSGSIDRSWAQLIGWLERSGLACFPVPAVMDGGDRSWVEYMEAKPLACAEEAELFYERSGLLLCLLFALGGDDFHMENVIAYGAYPVLIDTETLLLHRVKPFGLGENGMDSRQQAHNRLLDSVLRTGLLPIWMTDAKGIAYDSGGLSGRKDGVPNIPVLQGEKLNVTDYESSLVRGFERSYRFLLERREELLGGESPLKLFAGSKLRTLLRSTQVYGDLLERVTHPNYLRSGAVYSIELERLAAAYLLHDSGEELDHLWKCFESERDALENGDIPIFYGYAGGTALHDASGELHPGFFLESALDRCKAIIAMMSEADLKSQTDYIRASLHMFQPASRLNDGALANVPKAEIEAGAGCALEGGADVDSSYELQRKALLDEANRIYEEIMERRLEGPDGDLSWIVVQADPSSHKMMLGSIPLSLYDGISGLSVFMSALYRLTGDPELKRRTLSVLSSFRKSLRDPHNPLPVHRLTLGLGSGVAGLVRALRLTGEYLQDDSLIRDAAWIVGRVQPDQIAGDRQLDQFGGAAGLIAELSHLFELTDDERMLELAKLCGGHLLGKRTAAKSGRRAWDNNLGSAPLLGAAHGAAGIASSLLRLHRLTGDDAYREAALEAIDYENLLYDAEAGNWPDLRIRLEGGAGPRKTFMTGWCSGAPGIGLARLDALRSAPSACGESLLSDIERAIAFTLRHPIDSGDTLCCGNAGRLDFLTEASLLLERPDLLAEARRRASALAERGRKEGGRYRFSGSEGGIVFNPALFHGSAGIGYALLRCAEPEKISSLLR